MKTISEIDPSTYGKELERLIAFDKINDLGPGLADQDFFRQLSDLDFSRAVGPNLLKDKTFAAACEAALWLRHDFLDASHTISQGILNTTGSYWHGLMHRREGDYWNSKYWFRQVGNHPVFNQLLTKVKQLLVETGSSQELFDQSLTTWDPLYFIDLVEESIGSNSAHESLYRQIQRHEWLILFEYSYRMATGT